MQLGTKYLRELASAIAGHEENVLGPTDSDACVIALTALADALESTGRLVALVTEREIAAGYAVPGGLPEAAA